MKLYDYLMEVEDVRAVLSDSFHGNLETSRFGITVKGWIKEGRDWARYNTFFPCSDDGRERFATRPEFSGWVRVQNKDLSVAIFNNNERAA